MLLARQIGKLLGAWLDAPDGSRNASDLLAFGTTIGLAGETTSAIGREAFVNLASYLVDEWETIYGIVSVSTDTETRQSELLARARAGFVGAPATIVTAIQLLAGADADVVETPWHEVTATPERVFSIIVRVDADVYGEAPDHTMTMTRIEAVVDRMKPAHVEAVYTGTQTDGFLTDDQNSLTDNTVLRA